MVTPTHFLLIFFPNPSGSLIQRVKKNNNNNNNSKLSTKDILTYSRQAMPIADKGWKKYCANMFFFESSLGLFILLACWIFRTVTCRNDPNDSQMLIISSWSKLLSNPFPNDIIQHSFNGHFPGNRGKSVPLWISLAIRMMDVVWWWQLENSSSQRMQYSL